MMRIMLMVCLLVALCVKFRVNACRCAVQHPQKLYCNSDFVIRGRVLEANAVPGYQKVYSIQVLKVFKGNYVPTQNPMPIYTALRSAGCGVYLQLDKEYILGGDREEGKWYIDSCGVLKELWDRGNTCVKENVNDDRYKNNCICKLKDCRGDIDFNGVCQRNVRGSYGQCVWVPCIAKTGR